MKNANANRDLAALAREIRDQQLALAAPGQRPALKATWDLRTDQLVEWQKNLTAVLERAREGRHGVPTSLIENRRIVALEAWIAARCSEAAWEAVIASAPKPRSNNEPGGGWIQAWWLRPVFPPE